jgi:hypothetical protein
MEMTGRDKAFLWTRWLVANSLGELVGLGATFAVGFGAFSFLGEPQGLLGAVALALAMMATGALEGAIVGAAQWLAMRPWFPGISARAWILATLAGALVAWFLGSLPSALLSQGDDTAQAAAAEPSLAVVLLLAGLLGMVLGAVLAFVQWLVLRRVVDRAWTWLSANALAWLAGMPLVFAAVGAIQEGMAIWQAVLLLALALALTGAVVGAIHGLFLVRLAARAQEGGRP